MGKKFFSMREFSKKDVWAVANSRASAGFPIFNKKRATQRKGTNPLRTNFKRIKS
jgi:hypothetical protein